MGLKSHFKKMNKNLIAFILFVLFWASFFTITGTVTSGYHFRDDHEIISINKNVQELGLIDASKTIIKKDLDIRFRPFYYFNRAVLTKLFGTNFLLWSLYNAVLAIFSAYFLFLFIYRQSYKFIHALLFPFLVLIGAQSAIWWRLGPAETVGFFLLSASLFFLVNSIFRKKKYQLLISVVLLFLATLSKESFTLFIPAYILLLLYFKYQREPDKTIFNIIRSNIIVITSLLVILLIELYIIVFVVGTNKIGYAGIDSSFNIIKFLKFVYAFLQHNVYIYLILFGLFLLFQSLKSCKVNLNIDLKKWMPYAFNFIILLAIIVPQFLLYNKSGFFERYLLPLNLGFSLVVVFLLKNIYRNNNIALFSKKIFTIAIIWVICSFLKNDTLPIAKSFAKEGELTNKFLSTIVDNTKTNDSILVVLNGNENFEYGISLNKYLKIKANRKHINFFTVDTKLKNDFEKHLSIRFSQIFNNNIVDEINTNFSCIAVLRFSTNKAIKAKIDSNNDYQRNDFDYFTVYTRK